MASLETKIYVGPSLLNEGLFQNAIFIGGYPSNVKTLIEDSADIQLLIVPIADTALAMAAIHIPGTPEYEAYARLAGTAPTSSGSSSGGGSSGGTKTDDSVKVSLTVSDVTLAVSGDNGRVTGKQASPGACSTARLNIWGTTFSVKIEAQMWDGTWRTLTGADFSSGTESSAFTTTGIYDFDVSGFQAIAANVVSGSANVKGAFLP